jgi:hypothetical protein
VVAPVDPRIHFALVCGARSCPPIKLYSPETLDEGLTGAAEAFCDSEVAVDLHARKVRCCLVWWSVGMCAASTACWCALACMLKWMCACARCAITPSQVTLSKIFDWYFVDFGADKASRLRYLLPFLRPAKRGALQQLLDADPSARRIRVAYSAYDWTINAA